MADRGFTKNQCRSKWKRIRTKALLATEYGMKLKDADENELDDDDNESKSAQKAILGLTKSLNDFGSVNDRPSVPATASASEVTVAVATSEGTGVTEEVLSEIAATPTSFGKIEWKPEDSDYLVELIQTKFKSRKVDWGWIAQQMEGRGYDKAQCKSRWWRVQHRSHNRNGSHGGNSIGTTTSSRGKRASISQSDDASVHEDDRPVAAVQMEEDDSKSEAKVRDHRQWGSAEYEDVDMSEEPIHPPSRLEEAPYSLPVVGKSESQRGYRGTTAAGTRSTGAGPDSPQTPSGPTQKHIEWKEEDSQFMFKMIEREFPVGNIVWSVIAERMASRGYSQTQCMSKWRRHLKSMKKSADEQAGMDIDGAEESAPAYQQHQHQPHRLADRQGYSRPTSPRFDNDYDGYDSYRSRKRFNGSEQFQQHAATHFQHPPPYGHPSSGSSGSTSRGAPLHHRSVSGYSHPIEAEYDRYYDSGDHHRFDSYSAELDHSRAGGNKQHDRYPSYGSEYAAFADEGRRRMDRPRPSEYADDREYYDYAGRRHRPFPPPADTSHTYSPRYPDVDSERPRSVDRRRDYHHFPQEGQNDSDRYGTPRMMPNAGGMVAASHRGENRVYNERDRYRYDNDGGDLYGQDDLSNPSKRAKRAQPNEYGPDDYYDSTASYPYPPPQASAFARRDGPAHEYSYRRERMPRPEHPYSRRSPMTPLARGQDFPEKREHGDWETPVKDPRLSPTPPMSSGAAPAEYSSHRSNQPSPTASGPLKQRSPLPQQYQQPTEQGSEAQHKEAPRERSPSWHPMETNEEGTHRRKNFEGEESGKPINNPPPADTTASTPIPSIAQASHRPASSPLPAHARMHDREQKDNTTPEPRTATTTTATAAVRRETSPGSPAIRPSQLPHDGHAHDRDSHGREGYYYDDEYYGSRNRERAAATWDRDDDYYHSYHHGPQPSRRSHPSMAAPAASTAPDHGEHHSHGSSASYHPSQHPSYRMPPPPPPVSSSLRTLEGAEGPDPRRRREEWLDRGRYEMSDMQQLADELERQGRKWDTIRREIRIPRLTSPFEEHEREYQGEDGRARMAVDEYPGAYHRGHRVPYGTSYGNGPRRHPSPPPSGRPHPQPSSAALSSSRPSSMASPPLRSSASGRRRSFAMATGGPDLADPSSPSFSQPPSSYPSPALHRSQPPPYAPYRDRLSSSSSAGSGYPQPSNSNVRSSLRPHFSYSHYGTSATSSPNQVDHQQGYTEELRASKRDHPRDGLERDDENMMERPVMRAGHRESEMDGKGEEDVHPDRRIQERRPVAEQDREQDRQEDGNDAAAVQHLAETERATDNATELQQHQHRQEDDQSHQEGEGHEAASLVSPRVPKDEDGDAEDRADSPSAMSQPSNNTTATAIITSRTGGTTPQKDEPSAGRETTVITAGKDDSQEVNSTSG
ncbi:hypothetical protein BGZ73_009059 [Actinomortierella ambigua]|nr:hypothetical protein BGZ73_009059 [Actinomortierella ambigua]